MNSGTQRMNSGRSPFENNQGLTTKPRFYQNKMMMKYGIANRSGQKVNNPVINKVLWRQKVQLNHSWLTRAQ